MKGPLCSFRSNSTLFVPYNPYYNTMIIVMITCLIHVSRDTFLSYTKNWAIFILHREIYYSI